MRNLTLGVLILTGGTLAALPFQRDGSSTGASAIPEEATGPTHSVLNPQSVVHHQSFGRHRSAADSSDMFPARNLLSATSVDPTVLTSTRRPVQPMASSGANPGNTGFMPMQTRNQQATAPWQDRAPSRVDKPLTIEDLMEPIERPESVRQRFDAVATIRQNAITRSRELAVKSPSTTEVFSRPVDAVAQDAARSQLPTTVIVLPAPTPRHGRPPFPKPGQTGSSPTKTGGPKTGGSLVSTIGPLPEPSATPTRQWIVQP